MLFEFIGTDKAGKEMVFETVKLTNASIADLKRTLDEHTPEGARDRAGRARLSEDRDHGHQQQDNGERRLAAPEPLTRRRLLGTRANTLPPGG